jgi:hypothetical protein
MTICIFVDDSVVKRTTELSGQSLTCSFHVSAKGRSFKPSAKVGPGKFTLKIMFRNEVLEFFHIALRVIRSDLLLRLKKTFN